MSMIEINNLSYGYGNKTILDKINANINENEVTVILGPNGCGKTTFLKVVAGILHMKTGVVRIKGKSICDYKGKDMAKIVAFMPQMRHVPVMTVEDFIMCARYPYLGISKKPIEKDLIAVNDAMKIVGITNLKDKLIKKLSGGERQKVYFAFMLAQETEILLLDEPTTYLDTNNQYEMLDLIESMKNTGKTIVMVLHDVVQGLKYADNIIVMNDGKLEFSGTPKAALGVLEKLYNVKIKKINIDNKEEYIILR